jgi:hypothetical protein
MERIGLDENQLLDILAGLPFFHQKIAPPARIKNGGMDRLDPICIM